MERRVEVFSLEKPLGLLYIFIWSVFLFFFSPLISLHLFSCFELFIHVKKNGIKDLKRLKAVLEVLVKQQAKLKVKLNLVEHDSLGEGKPTTDQLWEVNRRLAKFNAWTQIYIETKLADPAWDAANTGNWCLSNPCMVSQMHVHIFLWSVRSYDYFIINNFLLSFCRFLCRDLSRRED